MSGKVKVTEWQKDALEGLEQEYGKGSIVRQHVLGRWGDAYDSLNKLSVDEIARALYIGYEVEPEFKVGDWVVTTSNAIAKITRVEGNRIYAIWRKGEGEKWNISEVLRHATPEEIKAEKERRVWAKIGREVGEFRDGDRGIHSSNTSIIKKDYMKDCYEGGTLEGFYPAESFISFGGDDE